MTNILKLLNEYNEAIASIGVLTTFFGGIIGYFIKSIKDRKSSLKKENEDLKKENESLKQQIQTLNDQLEQYKFDKDISNEIKESPLGGECLFWEKQNKYICPICWYNKRSIAPVYEVNDTGYFECQICGLKGKYNPQTIREVQIMVDRFLHKLNH